MPAAIAATSFGLTRPPRAARTAIRRKETRVRTVRCVPLHTPHTDVGTQNAGGNHGGTPRTCGHTRRTSRAHVLDRRAFTDFAKSVRNREAVVGTPATEQG